MPSSKRGFKTGVDLVRRHRRKELRRALVLAVICAAIVGGLIYLIYSIAKF